MKQARCIRAKYLVLQSPRHYGRVSNHISRLALQLMSHSGMHVLPSNVQLPGKKESLQTEPYTIYWNPR